MKRLISFLIAVSIGIASLAQTTHMHFMGVPIDGTMRNFISQMQKKGFSIAETDSDQILRGKFAGHDVTLLMDTYGLDNIYQVTVVCERQSRWHILKSEFNTLVDRYTLKYGEPVVINRDFKDSYSDGCGIEIYGVWTRRVDWLAHWLVEGGAITMCIAAGSPSEGAIAMVYYDMANGGLAQIKNDTDL